MKSEEMELDILKRQNREMAIRLQLYRVQNQQIKAKNQELNQWVGNLSQVFSTVSASWESITILQETLLTLMKKKPDVKDKTLLRKYQNHFKTFADIISNLGDKIMNKGHSDQATNDAKEQLRSFVKNYQLFFKQLIETYFKFNQDYTQYLNQLKSREDIKEQVRNVLAKSLQSTQRIKQFQSYVESLKEKFQVFQQFNKQKLLQGVVKKKEQQILLLKERNNVLQRRIKVIFDYNNDSVNMQLGSEQDNFQCICGGAQLSYIKKLWQQRIKSSNQKSPENQCSTQKNGIKNESIQILQNKLASVQEQKQNLITRNSLLLQKISKMSAQFKLTQEVILRSNVYFTLKQQCQHLMDYVTQLFNKLKKQQDFIFLIQKARQQQIKQLKKKLQKSKDFSEKGNSNQFINHFNNPHEVFKTDILTLTKQLIQSYQQLNKKHVKSQQSLKQFKHIFESLKKSNQQLNKKISQLQGRQLSKTDGLQFKYQKYKQIQSNVQVLLEKNLPNLNQLWKQFIIHVKSRDKKIKDLQATMRKKDKQMAQKTQIQQLMKTTMNQTQKIYTQNKQKLDKTEAFIKKVQNEMIRLQQQNYKIQTQSQQDKSLLSLRLKAETQARNKLQQKLSILTKIESQFAQVRENQYKLQKSYSVWIESQKKALDDAKKDLLENQITIKNQCEQINQKNKQLQKLQCQKQGLNSSMRELKNRVESLKSTNENEVLKMELEQYKSKIMCSCTGDRQRQVVLKTCPHLFCKKCIEDTTLNRNRKCPLCGIRFTKNDVHQIKWT